MNIIFHTTYMKFKAPRLITDYFRTFCYKIVSEPVILKILWLYEPVGRNYLPHGNFNLRRELDFRIIWEKN